MEKTPFFKTDCPSCGAPVEAYCATAVTLVCGHCHSMLVVRKGKKKSGSIVSYSERDSALLEDFSPLQIGTRGVFAHRNFTLNRKIAGALRCRRMERIGMLCSMMV